MTPETMNCSPFNASGSRLSLSPPSSRFSNGTTPLKLKPMKRKPNPNHASIYRGSAIAPCTECGKRFNSWKALFGHMRCHPERPWRGMNRKQKEKKPKLRVKKNGNWAHITDEVTRAALILMEMSGQSVGDIVDCMRRSCKEKEQVGEVQTDTDMSVMDAEKEFVKLEKPLLDLNLVPLVDY